MQGAIELVAVGCRISVLCTAGAAGGTCKRPIMRQSAPAQSASHTFMYGSAPTRPKSISDFFMFTNTSLALTFWPLGKGTKMSTSLTVWLHWYTTRSPCTTECLPSGASLSTIIGHTPSRHMVFVLLVLLYSRAAPANAVPASVSWRRKQHHSNNNLPSSSIRSFYFGMLQDTQQQPGHSNERSRAPHGPMHPD